MAYPFVDRNRQSIYFTTEALQKPKDVFEKVHLPIDLIAVDFYREGSYEKFTNEAELIRWILNSNGRAMGNRIFALVGETGSGKSEICQAIFYAAKDSKEHVPILISRSLTRLRDIVRLLHEHADMAEEDDIAEITAMSPETVRSAAVTGCLTILDRRLAKLLTPERAQQLRMLLQEEAFGCLIDRAFRRYKVEVITQKLERSLDLLDRGEFVKLMTQALPWVNVAETFALFRDAINDEMKRLVQLGDISGCFRAIAERYQAKGQRPVLILEDLTSFGFVKEDLLDHLFDLSQGNFDVVIGWTTGFEAEHFLKGKDDQARSYMIERMKGRFLTTSTETRGSYFLARNHLRMIRRYMDAIRPDFVEVLPDPFYPLNQFAVTRIYNQLVDDRQRQKQTPRLLIDVIGQVLQREEEPWQVLETHPNLAQEPLADKLVPQKVTHPDAVLVAKWYGRPSDGKVSASLVKRLGLTWPESLRHLLVDEPIQYTETQVSLGEVGTGSDDSGQETRMITGAGTPIVGAGQKDKPGGGTDTTSPQATDPLAHVKTDLQKWLDGKDFPSRNRLKDGIHFLVDFLTEHDVVRGHHSSGGALRYRKEQVPVYLDGTKETNPEFPAIRLNPSYDDYDAYLGALHIRSKDDAKKAIEANPLLVAWVHRLVAAFQAEQRKYLADRLGVSMEAFIYHAWVLVKGLCDGLRPADGKSFLMPALAEKPLTERTTVLRNRQLVRALLDVRPFIKELYASFFFVTPTTADAEVLSRAAAEYDPFTMIQRLNLVKKSFDVGFRVAYSIADEKGKAKQREVTLEELVQVVRKAAGDLAAFPAQEEVAKSFLVVRELAGWADGLTEELFDEQKRSIFRLAGEIKVMNRTTWGSLNPNTDQERRPPADWVHTGASLRAVMQMAERVRTGFDLFPILRRLAVLEGNKEVAPGAERDPGYNRLSLLREVITDVESVMRDRSAHQAHPGVHERAIQQDRTDCEDAYHELLALVEG